METRVIIGIISCIASDTPWREYRIRMHRKQLNWLENTYKTMTEQYREPAFPIYRVEQGWDNATSRILSTSLPLTSIKYNSPITPGAARNVLLNLLYGSDADWLVCLDDDHILYDHYNGCQLIWDLPSKPFIDLAKRQILISAFPAYRDGFKKDIEAFGKADTHWYLRQTKHPGAMPFCCIPNIFKYKQKQLFFDEVTTANKPGDVPEDLKFTIDWIKQGGRVYECVTAVCKSLGSLNHSTLFVDAETRHKRDLEWVPQWATSYLKTLYPRQPELWVKHMFFQRKNPKCIESIPRQIR